MTVQSWQWRRHTSRASGKDMLLVSYYGGLSDPAVSEYFPVMHDGYAGQKALATVADIAQSAKVTFSGAITLDDWADTLNAASVPPATINYRRDGRFYRVLRREWA
jgi:DNA repair protein RadD